ncbi:hypothetical protein Tsubulata_009991, partial [Turnera subulata]
DVKNPVGTSIFHHFLVSAFIILTLSNILPFGYSTESPRYTVLFSQPEYEIRLYKEISWMCAFLQGNSFQKSTKDGFHRIYQYIQGANSNSSRLAITAPVLTSIRPSPNGTTGYRVKLFLITNFGATPPQPSPELNLQIDKWRAKCVAVRKFPGFAMDDNVSKEAEALVTSLSKYFAGGNMTGLEDKRYTIAQYNASSHLVGRLNEVWVDVSAIVNIEGCPRP